MTSASQSLTLPLRFSEALTRYGSQARGLCALVRRSGGADPRPPGGRDGGARGGAPAAPPRGAARAPPRGGHAMARHAGLRRRRPRRHAAPRPVRVAVPALGRDPGAVAAAPPRHVDPGGEHLRGRHAARLHRVGLRRPVRPGVVRPRAVPRRFCGPAPGVRGALPAVGRLALSARGAGGGRVGPPRGTRRRPPRRRGRAPGGAGGAPAAPRGAAPRHPGRR